jgi:nucleoside phosphorylase
MIAVTFALPAESSDFIRRLGKREDIRVVHTGVGRNVAAERIRVALAQTPPPALLISAGFAGALNGQLALGELLLADNFSDAERLQAARHALADTPHRVGKLATADAVLDLPAERRKFAHATGAVAIDIET